MQRIRSLVQKKAVCLFVAALCLALPFFVPSLFVTSFFGAAILFGTVLSLDPKTEPCRYFRLGFGFAFSYHLFGYHWLLALHPLVVAGIDGLLSLLIVASAWVAASALHALFFALGFLLFGVLRRASERGAVQAILLLACLLVASSLTEVGSLAFPWARFALPLAEVPSLAASAALFGEIGVDAWLLSVGALLSFAVRLPRRRVLSASLAAALVLTNLLFGVFYRAPEGEESLRVCTVQTNYGFMEKWSTDPSSIRSELRSVARAVKGEGIDLIVFPESVLAVTVQRGDSNEAFFAELSEESDALVAAGCLFYEEGKTYNAVCLFDSTGLLGYNAKRHLVPFGEYLPWQDVLKVILPAVGNMDFFRTSLAVGESGVVAEAMGVTFGGLVCFDTLFSSLAVDSAKEGGQILLAPTNDAWFKDSVASRQHLWHGTFRAIESGKSLVQSANTGISALVDYTGECLGKVEPLTKGYAISDVPLSALATPYAATGPLVQYAAWACALGFLAFVLRRRRRV